MTYYTSPLSTLTEAGRSFRSLERDLPRTSDGSDFRPNEQHLMTSSVGSLHRVTDSQISESSPVLFLESRSLIAIRRMTPSGGERTIPQLRLHPGPAAVERTCSTGPVRTFRSAIEPTFSVATSTFAVTVDTSVLHLQFILTPMSTTNGNFGTTTLSTRFRFSIRRGWEKRQAPQRPRTSIVVSRLTAKLRESVQSTTFCANIRNRDVFVVLCQG